MSKKVLKFVIISFLAIGLCTIVNAQRQTGSLRGTFVDENSEPLPGASIQILGPSLMGAKTYVTSDTGGFRFPALPPGTYTIICELQGFKKVRQEGIIIRVGKTMTITMHSEPTAIEEEVTVIAIAPVVDLSASKISISFTKDLLVNVPMRRDLYDVINTAPGMISENDTRRRTSSSHGSDVADNQYNVDGVSVTEPVCLYPMLNVSYDLFEEVEIEIGAHPAEVASVAGAYINIVTSSGGNKFHGRGSAYYFDDSFVDTNFSQEQLDTLGVSKATTEKYQRDVSLNLGGYIIKDKLWFFTGGRYLNYGLEKNFPEDVTHTELFGFAKLTFQLSKRIKLTGAFNYIDTYEPYLQMDARPDNAVEATTKLDHEKNILYRGQLNWIISQNAFFDIQGMWLLRMQLWRFQPEATHRNFDRGTGMNTGAARWEEEGNPGRTSIKSSLSLFADDFLGGNHEFKTGAEFENTWLNIYLNANKPIHTFTFNGSPYFFGDNRGRFTALAMTTNKEETHRRDYMRRIGFYVQDSWTIKQRLVLNLGFRFDSSRANFPEQTAQEISFWMWLDPDWMSKKVFPKAKNVMVFNSLSPRLGMAFDIFGNGKTIAKASYSRYHAYLRGTWYGAVNPNSFSVQEWLWTDENWDGQIDSADSFTKVFELGRLVSDPKDAIDPDLKVPYWNEITLGVDHELLPEFRLGLRYIYKIGKNIFFTIERNRDQNWSIQHTVADPGYDGVFGTGDDATLKVWDKIGFEGFVSTNPPEARRKYQALEFVFEKRLSNKWQLLSSVTFSKTYGNVGTGYRTTQGRGAFSNPNYMINREGRTGFDRPLVIKMQGTYQLPYGLNLSAVFIHSSGTPFTREVNVFVPNSGYVMVNAEPQGTRRNPSWNRLDLRLEKRFAFGGDLSMGLFLDVFNALNTGYITTTSGFHGFIEGDGSFTTDPRWNTVYSVSAPRIIKFGLRFTF